MRAGFKSIGVQGRGRLVGEKEKVLRKKKKKKKGAVGKGVRDPNTGGQTIGSCDLPSFTSLLKGHKKTAVTGRGRPQRESIEGRKETKLMEGLG